TVIPPHDSAEDAALSHEPPPQLVSRLAWQKAKDVAQRTARGIVIGCDTVAECQGQILGKPRDRADARRMLEMLRGQEHRVFSGLCLWQRPEDIHRTEIDVTRHIMDPL